MLNHEQFFDVNQSLLASALKKYIFTIFWGGFLYIFYFFDWRVFLYIEQPKNLLLS